MEIVVSWIVMALAVVVTAYILPGVTVTNFLTALLVALVLGIINAFVKPVLVVLTLPINIVTLGLFTFVLNALLIMGTAAIIDGFRVANFWWALLFSIILSIVSSLLLGVFK